MKCAVCKHDQHSVIATNVLDEERIRRRRKCDRCKYRWTTFELTERALPKIDLEAAIENVRSLERILSGG